MNERDLGPTVTRREAYRKGWDASRRTTTADLEAAEARFAERYGVQHMAAFTRGWTDYAADHPKDPDSGTRTTTYGDLPESTATNGLVLFCPCCGQECSATRGDYFMADPTATVECGEDSTPMLLGRWVRHFKEMTA